MQTDLFFCRTLLYFSLRKFEDVNLHTIKSTLIRRNWDLKHLFKTNMTILCHKAQESSTVYFHLNIFMFFSWKILTAVKCVAKQKHAKKTSHFCGYHQMNFTCFFLRRGSCLVISFLIDWTSFNPIESICFIKFESEAGIKWFLNQSCIINFSEKIRL